VTRSRQISRFGMAAGMLLLLVSLGCGDNSNFQASVSSTAHPLVAKYSIVIPPQGAVAWIEFGPDLNYGRQTSMTAATTSSGQLVNILVAGMKANTTYHLRAHVTWAGQSWVDQDQTFTTGKLPTLAGNATLPTITVTRPTPSLTPSSGVELFNLVVPGNMLLSAFVTDLEGNVIWYYYPGSPGLSTVPMRLMPSGNFLIHLTDLLEVDLAGNVLRDINVEKVNQGLVAKGYTFTISDFHHDVIVLPSGHWITLANTSKKFTNLPGYPGVTDVLGDALIDIDLNGNVAWAWSGFDHLDVNRHLQGLPDWTHSNAIVYTADHNLLVSMRHQSWILKLDYADGKGAGDILWRLGEDGDFAIAGGDISDWFYAQHFPNLESTNGSHMSLAIFDNGNLRLAADGQACLTTCYSRATLFDVDEGSMVATLLWDYLPGFYSFWGGSIGTLSNGDVEFDMATVAQTPASQVMEVTADDNPKTVWQLNVTGANSYRAYRIPSLYPGVTWKN
jgi:arylsulfate sulfotransferase